MAEEQELMMEVDPLEAQDAALQELLLTLHADVNAADRDAATRQVYVVVC